MKILELDDGWKDKMREYIRGHHTFQNRDNRLVNQICDLIIAYVESRIKKASK